MIRVKSIAGKLMPEPLHVTNGYSIMDDDVDPSGESDSGDVRKCRVHGLFFDAEIAGTCPLCERERADRIAGTTRR